MVMIKPKTRVSGRPASGVKFQYKARTPEQVRERAQRQIGGRDSYFSSDIQFFTPREGDNNVRILPPPPDADWGHYGINVVVHYAIGSDQSAYLCAARMKDEPCPICEERDRATSAGEEDLADSLRPSFRVAVYVIDRAQEGKGPLLWNIAGGLDKDITKLCIDPASGEILPVDDPNDGYDLNFTREGSGLKTKYKGIQFSRKTCPLADDPEQADSWLKHVVDHPIDSCLQYFDYDYIAKVFAGQAPAIDDEDVTNTKQKATPAAKPAASKTKIQPRGKQAAPTSNKADNDGLTWADLEALDEDGLVSLGEEKSLEFPDSFDSVDALREFIAEQLNIEKEEVEQKPAASKANWRDRLKAAQGKK
mgnify:CR=1 FL=1